MAAYQGILGSSRIIWCEKISNFIRKMCRNEKSEHIYSKEKARFYGICRNFKVSVSE
jgi:hypothetical protein